MESPDKDLVGYYDRRYAQGYQESLCGYEYARWEGLRHVLEHFVTVPQGGVVLDYGCGNGLFTPLLAQCFPEADLWGCDISATALEQLRKRLPGMDIRLEMVRDDVACIEDASVDLCVSVEVMEHVADLDSYMQDVTRVLKPGGTFVWTTPCSNRFSLEHFIALAKDRITPTDEGYRRWAWEDPGHLRRLRSGEAAERLERNGMIPAGFRFRAHFFSYVCDRLIRRFPARTGLWSRMMLLDYLLFRRIPWAASMIGWATKPTERPGQ